LLYNPQFRLNLLFNSNVLTNVSEHGKVLPIETYPR
jgi:hypothetical protein